MPISKTPEIGIGRHAGECQRYAPVIVEGRDGGMHLSGRRKRMAQHLLGGGLADRTGHRDDTGPAAVTRRKRQFAKSGENVLHHDHRHRQFAERGQFRLVDDDQRRTVGDREARIVVAVDAITLDGEKSLVLADGTAVDRNAGDARRKRTDRAAAHGSRQILGCP
jgi:hypothetical protein